MINVKKAIATVLALTSFGTTSAFCAVIEKEFEETEFSTIATAVFEDEQLPKDASVYITNTGTDYFNETLHTFGSGTLRLKTYRGNGAQFNGRQGYVTFEYLPKNMTAQGIIRFETNVVKGAPHMAGNISLVFEEGVRTMEVPASWKNVTGKITCTYNTYTGDCYFLFDAGEEHTKDETQYAVKSDYSPMKLIGFSLASKLGNDTRVNWTIGEVKVSSARVSHAELNKVGNGVSLSWYKRPNAETTKEEEDKDWGFVIDKVSGQIAKISQKSGTKCTTVSVTADNSSIDSSIGFVLENLVDCTPTIKTKAGAKYNGGSVGKSDMVEEFVAKTSLGANGEKLLNIDYSLKHTKEHNTVWFLLDKSAASSVDGVNLEEALKAGKVIDAGFVTMDGKKGENLMSLAVNMGNKEGGQYYFVLGNDAIDLSGNNVKAITYSPEKASSASLSALVNSNADNLEKNLADCVKNHAPLSGIDLDKEPYKTYSKQVTGLLIDAIKDCKTFADVRVAFEESSVIAQFNSMTSTYDKVQLLKEKKDIFNCNFEGDYVKYKMTAGEYMKYFLPKYETTKMMTLEDIKTAHYYALAMRSINYIKQWSKNSEFEYVLAGYNSVYGLDLNNAKYKQNKANVYEAFEGMTLVVPQDVSSAFNAWVNGKAGVNMSDCAFILENLKVSQDKILVDVTRRLTGDGQAIVVALFYDGAGKLMGMSKSAKNVKVLNTVKVEVPVTVKNADKVKVHAWDTSSGMKMGSLILSNK